MVNLRVFFLAFLVLASPFLQVAWCQSDSENSGTVAADAGEVGEVGIVDEDAQNVFDLGLSPAPGIETVCVFPKNSAKLITAGEEAELLVRLQNDGYSSIDIVAVKGSVHLPFDHRLLVQNLTSTSFNNASVPTSAQASFPYIFAVSKYLQIDGQPYQNTFYNGTIEVVESGSFVSMESVFLVSLGVALLVLLGLWIHGRLQRFTKKTKKAPKVEVGTATREASLDEWLEGTAYIQSLSSKSKKK